MIYSRYVTKAYLRHITMERQCLRWWMTARPCIHPLHFKLDNDLLPKAHILPAVLCGTNWDPWSRSMHQTQKGWWACYRSACCLWIILSWENFEAQRKPRVERSKIEQSWSSRAKPFACAVNCFFTRVWLKWWSGRVHKMCSLTACRSKKAQPTNHPFAQQAEPSLTVRKFNSLRPKLTRDCMSWPFPRRLRLLKHDYIIFVCCCECWRIHGKNT